MGRLALLPVAVHEGLGGHGVFAFRLELVNDDEIAIFTLQHKWGIRVDAGSFAENVGNSEDVGLLDDASFVHKDIFWFRKVLVGDNLPENLFGSKLGWLQKTHGFCKFLSKSSCFIILRSGG